jgi:hypothetical protein
MSNEQYLIVSYFTIGVVAVVLAGITYAALRRSFTGLLGALPVRNFSRILRKLSFPGLVLPALIGFFSVSFRACDGDSYGVIIADRSHLVLKNQEQLSATLEHIAYALLFWGITVLVYLLFLRAQQTSGND